MAPYKPGDPQKEWHTSVLAQLPWLRLAALLGATGCCAAAAFGPNHSDGKSIHDWTLQPTVYLAIASAAAKILLHFAFALAEGVNVARWRPSRKKIQQSTTAIATGTTVIACGLRQTSEKHVNKVAGASCPAAFAPTTNGPLLQCASTMTSQPALGRIPLSASIAPELPDGYKTLSLAGWNLSLSSHQPSLPSCANTQTGQSSICTIRAATACANPD